MGIGNSREPYGLRQKRRSPKFGILRRKNNRRGYFGRISSDTTTELILPPGTLPISYQPLHGSHYANRQFPVYASFPPTKPPFLPMPYNNYSALSNIPLQYMMMLQQRVPISMPGPYMPPPMSMPYVQQPRMQYAYNNIGGFAVPVPVGNGVYPPLYSSVPMRLITDWTGGGKISPGFLGPPI